MKKKETIFDYIGLIFLIFGFTIICLNFFLYSIWRRCKRIFCNLFIGKDGIKRSDDVAVFID